MPTRKRLVAAMAAVGCGCLDLLTGHHHPGFSARWWMPAIGGRPATGEVQQPGNQEVPTPSSTQPCASAAPDRSRRGCPAGRHRRWPNRTPAHPHPSSGWTTSSTQSWQPPKNSRTPHLHQVHGLNAPTPSGCWSDAPQLQCLRRQIRSLGGGRKASVVLERQRRLARVHR
jgi:hypothetical protein